MLSMDPLQQLHKRAPTPNLMKPYLNKEEMIEGFGKMFPARKDTLKIVVGEAAGKLLLALHLHIARGQNG